jgi:hypothetical protein
MSKALLLFKLRASGPTAARGRPGRRRAGRRHQPPIADNYIVAPEGGASPSRVADLAAQLPLPTVKAGQRPGCRAVNTLRVTARPCPCSGWWRPPAAL